MNILYILKHNPWGRGGGCYASRCYLEAYRRFFSNADIDLCICKEYVKDIDAKSLKKYNIIPVDERNGINRYISFLSGRLHRHHNTVIRLLKMKKYDYCIFDHSFIAGSLVKAASIAGTATITLHHNCEADYFSDNAMWYESLLLTHQIKKNECRAYKLSSFNMFLTEEDMYKFQSMYGRCQGKSAVIGCFEYLPLSTPPVEYCQKGKMEIVIAGSIGNVQNLDGINDFIQNYYKSLDKYTHVVIAGQNAPVQLIESCKNFTNITIINNPINMEAIIRKGDVFLCPARLGSGIKVRIMDGLRQGLPVLVHINSSRGYRNFVDAGYMKTYSDKKEFMEALSSLYIQLKTNPNLSVEIQKLYLKSFQLGSAIERISNMLNE